MTFERPDILLLAPVAALLLAGAVAIQWGRGRRLVEAYGGRVPARRLLGRDLSRFPLARLLALSAAAGGLAFAASGPAPEEAPPPPPPVPLDLMVAVDVSHSMSAADVDGRRIDRARALVEQLVEDGVAERVSLTIFADWPFGLVPLTHDPDVVGFFSPWITPDLVGTRDQGSSLALALGQARGTWETRPNDGARRVVLLVTDGEVHDMGVEVLDSVAAIADAGFEIWAAGVGTPEGAPLFLPGSEGAPLLYDGTPVVAGADPGFLREVAGRGRGEYHDASTDGGARGLLAALGRGSAPPPTTEEGPDPVRWVILAALVLLLLEALLDAGTLERRARRRAPVEAVPARGGRPKGGGATAPRAAGTGTGRAA